MADVNLTRKEIEAMRLCLHMDGCHVDDAMLDALCDLALRGVDASEDGALVEAALKVCAGFDDAVFCRDVRGDPRWAIRAMPYLAALDKIADRAARA